MEHKFNLPLCTLISALKFFYPHPKYVQLFIYNNSLLAFLLLFSAQAHFAITLYILLSFQKNKWTEKKLSLFLNVSPKKASWKLKLCVYQAFNRTWSFFVASFSLVSIFVHVHFVHFLIYFFLSPIEYVLKGSTEIWFSPIKGMFGWLDFVGYRIVYHNLWNHWKYEFSHIRIYIGLDGLCYLFSAFRPFNTIMKESRW